MGLDWKDVLEEGPRSTGRSRSGVRRLIAGAAVAAVLGIVIWLLLGGAGTPPEQEPPEKGGPRAGGDPDRPRIVLDLYPKEERLTGVELLAGGELVEAEEWLRSYLRAPDGRDDQALHALGLLLEATQRTEEAAEVYGRLARERQDSLRAGDALHGQARLLDAAGRADEARDLLARAVKYYPKSRGGMLSALRLADGLYEMCVARENRRSEWERVRDLYSVALPGIEKQGPEREAVVARLKELNGWVIFTPYSRPKPDYPSNISFHTVRAGDTLGGIARRYGVTIGSIRRLNGMAPDGTIIRPGEELKILRGRCEVFVRLSQRRMTAWMGGVFLQEYEIGIGRSGKTPAGRFSVATRVEDPPWHTPGGEVIPFGDPRNILGTRWLGFEQKGAGRGIGIHGSILKDGTWQGVGKAESNGCIRMRNPDVEELYDFVTIGTEVTIGE